jgi:drug/metabolite transporter (DMT)-like permease
LCFAGAGQAAIAFISLSALKYLSAATLTFLFYTYPAWVTVIAAIRRTEPLTPTRIGALALSLAGLTIMVGMPGSAGVHPVGVALALTAAIMYAVYIPMINHFGSSVPPALTGAYASGGAGIIFVVVALLSGGLSIRLAPIAWLAIILLAVVSTLIGFVAFLRGLAVIGPVRTAIVSTVEPFWAALLASLVIGQELSPRTLLGGALIAGAVIVLQLGQRSPTPALAS